MRTTLLFLFFLVCNLTFAQDVPTSRITSGFLRAIKEKSNKIQQEISGKTEQLIRKLQKQEFKIYRKLRRKDSIAANIFWEQSKLKYAEMTAKLSANPLGSKRLNEYLPAFDTMKSTLSFFDSTYFQDTTLQVELDEAREAVNILEGRMQMSNEIRSAVRERKMELTKQLSRYGIGRELKQVSKSVYYYQEQLKEYKAIMNDRKRIEQKAIAILRENKRFNEFMAKNSVLAQLFKVPDGYGSDASLATLQTVNSVQSLIQQRFSGVGINPQQQIQEQVRLSEARLGQLKAKLKKTGNVGHSNVDMPDGFKPNTQKVKSFLKRLEYGLDFQTQKVNSYFPVTTDFAVSLGYKLNDKSVVGVGVSYKLGWGSGINDIRITNEGAGLRSFMDLKFKGSIWITGGYEQNYYQRFSSLSQISHLNAWKQSCLMGFTKKMNSKNQKVAKVQLLYDFLHKANVNTQPFLFRIGYAF